VPGLKNLRRRAQIGFNAASRLDQYYFCLIEHEESEGDFTPELIRSVMQAESLATRRQYLQAITVPRYFHNMKLNEL
jgi:hypothetical protein